MVDLDREIALMYASAPFGIFHPRLSSYSPWQDVVLRVVPPRPRVEDFVLRLLQGASDVPAGDVPIYDTERRDSHDTTPDFDVSERMAREMQAEEDRKQWTIERRPASGHQPGGLFSSLFKGIETNEDVPPALTWNNVNAEAGPSNPKSKVPLVTRTTNFAPLSFAEDDEVIPEERTRQPTFFNHNLSPMDLLDNVEATLRDETNKFDFPERLDFVEAIRSSAVSSPPAPVLAYTANNASARTYERVLLDLLVALDAVANNEEEDVRMRGTQLVAKIEREIEELDRRVLELWAASRKYTPA